MLFKLIWKDILIAKKFLLITMLIMLVLPLMIVLKAPSLPGFLIFLYMVVLTDIMISQTISAVEEKYPKAITLLCATPYSRNDIVKAKYIFHFMVFIFCFVVYSFVMLLAGRIAELTLTSVLAVLLVSVIINGVYIPVVFKYGATKARFFFIVMIFAFSFGPTLFSSFFAKIDFSVLASTISRVSRPMLCMCLVVINVILVIFSLVVSQRIFSKKEL